MYAVHIRSSIVRRVGIMILSDSAAWTNSRFAAGSREICRRSRWILPRWCVWKNRSTPDWIITGTWRYFARHWMHTLNARTGTLADHHSRSSFLFFFFFFPPFPRFFSLVFCAEVRQALNENVTDTREFAKTSSNGTSRFQPRGCAQAFRGIRSRGKPTERHGENRTLWERYFVCTVSGVFPVAHLCLSAQCG